MDVVNLMVLQGGELDIGTQANPIAANVTATVVWVNQPLNTALDPEQYGNGLIVLGTMNTYGAVKVPYVTLSQNAHAGDTVLHLASPATGWQVGDKLQLPDTRQLDSNTTAKQLHARVGVDDDSEHLRRRPDHHPDRPAPVRPPRRLRRQRGSPVSAAGRGHDAQRLDPLAERDRHARLRAVHRPRQREHQLHQLHGHGPDTTPIVN